MIEYLLDKLLDDPDARALMPFWQVWHLRLRSRARALLRWVRGGRLYGIIAEREREHALQAGP
jgi:hypothetical protein